MIWTKGTDTQETIEEIIEEEEEEEEIKEVEEEEANIEISKTIIIKIIAILKIPFITRSSSFFIYASATPAIILLKFNLKSIATSSHRRFSPWYPSRRRQERFCWKQHLRNNFKRIWRRVCTNNHGNASRWDGCKLQIVAHRLKLFQ